MSDDETKEKVKWLISSTIQMTIIFIIGVVLGFLTPHILGAPLWGSIGFGMVVGFQFIT